MTNYGWCEIFCRKLVEWNRKKYGKKGRCYVICTHTLREQKKMWYSYNSIKSISRVFFQSFQLFFFYLFVLCGCSCWHNSSVIWQYMKWEMAFIAFNLFNRTLNRFPDFIAQLCKNNKKQRDTQNNNHVYSVVCFVCWISVCKWAVHVPNVSKTL